MSSSSSFQIAATYQSVEEANILQLAEKSDVVNGHLRASDKDSGSQASTRSSCKTPFPMLVRIGRFTFIQSPAYAVG